MQDAPAFEPPVSGSVVLPPEALPKHVTGERVTSVRRWTDRLFSFTLTRGQGLRFENGQFAMIGLMVEGRPLLRAYSMASANYEEQLEFLSIRVPDGPLTSRLGGIRIGDQVLVGRKPTGTLLLDNLRPGRTCVFLSTGTGLAPFLSLTKDPALYDRFEHVVMAHGVRQVDELAFRDRFEHELPRTTSSWASSWPASCTTIPAVTREPFRTQGRVTELLGSGRMFADLGLPPFDPDLDRVMICGSEAMLADAKALLLAERGMSGGEQQRAGGVRDREGVRGEVVRGRCPAAAGEALPPPDPLHQGPAGPGPGTPLRARVGEVSHTQRAKHLLGSRGLSALGGWGSGGRQSLPPPGVSGAAPPNGYPARAVGTLRTSCSSASSVNGLSRHRSRCPDAFTTARRSPVT